MEISEKNPAMKCLLLFFVATTNAIECLQGQESSNAVSLVVESNCKQCITVRGTVPPAKMGFFDWLFRFIISEGNNSTANMPITRHICDSNTICPSKSVFKTSYVLAHGTSIDVNGINCCRDQEGCNSHWALCDEAIVSQTKSELPAPSDKIKCLSGYDYPSETAVGVTQSDCKQCIAANVTRNVDGISGTHYFCDKENSACPSPDAYEEYFNSVYGNDMENITAEKTECCSDSDNCNRRWLACAAKGVYLGGNEVMSNNVDNAKSIKEENVKSNKVENVESSTVENVKSKKEENVKSNKIETVKSNKVENIKYIKEEDVKFNEVETATKKGSEESRRKMILTIASITLAVIILLLTVACLLYHRCRRQASPDSDKSPILFIETPAIFPGLTGKESDYPPVLGVNHAPIASPSIHRVQAQRVPPSDLMGRI